MADARGRMMMMLCCMIMGFGRGRAAARSASKILQPPPTPPEQTCGALEFDAGIFHEFFAYKFWFWGGLLQGRTLTSQQGRKNAEETFDLSTEEFRLTLASAGAELVARGCMLLCNHN